MAEIVVTSDNFEKEVMESGKPVLLDFWATWCGPCRMLAPAVANIAEKYEGRIKVGKINVDEEPELANAFGVQSIPMLVVMREGKVANVSVGYRPQEAIEALLD